MRATRIRQHRQQGGVTIVVALMLLVLLMVAALSMSRNSLREIFLTGGMRQASDVMSQADSGLEWALYWLGPSADRPAPAANQPGAGAFVAAWTLEQSDLSKQGVWMTIDASSPASPYTDLRSTDGLVTKSTDIEVMYMGKVARDPSSQNLPTQVTAQLAPDVYAIRSTATAAYANGPTFRHRREVWTTTAIRN